MSSLALTLTNDDLLKKILSFVSVLDRRTITTRVNRQWRRISGDCTLLVVTAAGSNELVLVAGTPSSCNGEIVGTTKAARPKRRRGRGGFSKSPRRNQGSQSAYCWPTCMAWGPNNSLFVSQYKIHGMLEFQRMSSVHGLSYQRMLLSDVNRLPSPEGLVYAHDSLYAASVYERTVSRISLKRGEQYGTIVETAHSDDPETLHWILWGMCIGPDQRTLFIAAHQGEDGLDATLPTQNDTGRILQIDLDTDGSFQSGFYSVDTPAPVRLNRPTEPAFCEHGILHVSSFVKTNDNDHGGDDDNNNNTRGASPTRVIYKFTGSKFHWLRRPTILDVTARDAVGPLCDAALPPIPPPPRCLGYLQPTRINDRARMLRPGGVAFARGHVYVTQQQELSSENHDSHPSVLKLDTCGCTAEILNRLWDADPESFSACRGLDCGDVTVLATGLDKVLTVLPL